MACAGGPAAALAAKPRAGPPQPAPTVAAVAAPAAGSKASAARAVGGSDQGAAGGVQAGKAPAARASGRPRAPRVRVKRSAATMADSGAGDAMGGAKPPKRRALAMETAAQDGAKQQCQVLQLPKTVAQRKGTGSLVPGPQARIRPPGTAKAKSAAAAAPSPAAQAAAAAVAAAVMGAAKPPAMPKMAAGAVPRAAAAPAAAPAAAMPRRAKPGERANKQKAQQELQVLLAMESLSSDGSETETESEEGSEGVGQQAGGRPSGSFVSSEGEMSGRAALGRGRGGQAKGAVRSRASGRSRVGGSSRAGGSIGRGGSSSAAVLGAHTGGQALLPPAHGAALFGLGGALSVTSPAAATAAALADDIDEDVLRYLWDDSAPMPPAAPGCAYDLATSGAGVTAGGAVSVQQGLLGTVLPPLPQDDMAWGLPVPGSSISMQSPPSFAQAAPGMQAHALHQLPAAAVFSCGGDPAATRNATPAGRVAPMTVNQLQQLVVEAEDARRRSVVLHAGPADRLRQAAAAASAPAAGDSAAAARAAAAGSGGGGPRSPSAAAGEAKVS